MGYQCIYLFIFFAYVSAAVFSVYGVVLIEGVCKDDRSALVHYLDPARVWWRMSLLPAESLLWSKLFLWQWTEIER